MTAVLGSSRQVPLRVLFVGGGTGGHLAPALGLAEALEARGHQALFLTSGRLVERSFLRQRRAQESLRLEGTRLPRPLALARAFVRAWRRAREFRPHLVVGLGGLAGAAAVAARGRQPLVLLEGNRVVGRGVRWLQPFAAATLTLFPETAAELPRGRWVGPIGRRALRPVPRGEARRGFGLDPDAPLLLAAGGSQGAEDLNAFAARLCPPMASRGFQLLALAGPGKAEALRSAAAAARLRAVVLEHLDEMGLAYSAADLALCRGGAATVAELWLAHLPAAIAPYPHHADRQQEHNARALGAGAILLGRLDAAEEEAVLRLLGDPERRRAMAEHLRLTAPPDGVERAADFLEQAARRVQAARLERALGVPQAARSHN